MDELLKKILASELLTEDTKAEFKTAFETFLNEAVETAKKDVEEKVRLELTEQYVADREKLIEALDTKAEEFFAKEIEELKEDINNYKDLEVEFAKKEVELKANLQEQLKSDLKDLVVQIDEFLDVVLNEEFEELKESIEEARKNDLGIKLFEAFAPLYRAHFVDEDKIKTQLDEVSAELTKKEQKLKEVQEELKQVSFNKKLDEVLSPLSGNAKQVMEALLKTQPIEKLEETYKKYVGRILNDSVPTNETHTKEKEDKVLAESDKSGTPVTEEKTVVKTGDLPAPVTESVKEEKVQILDNSTKHALKRLAGIE